MQKFPLRNQCKPNNNKVFGSSDTHTRIKGRERHRQREQQGRNCYSCSPHKMPPPAPATAQRIQQRICQPIASDATSLEKRQLSMEKPAVKVCNRVLTKEEADAENVATWNDLLSRSSFCCIRKDRGYYSKQKLKQDQKQKQHQSKSLLSSSSAVSFVLGKDEEVQKEKVVAVDSDIAPAERKEPSVQRIMSASAGEGTKLEVPCNATVSSSSSNKNTNKNNNFDTNGNRNKDDHDDDDNNRRRRSRLELKLGLEQHQNQHQYHQYQNHQSKTQTEAAIMSAAASAPEFITSERLRLGDQINFLLFDPYRTLKFLITELKSRLKTVVPDDINVQKILVEIQQTIKRIRIPNNATKPVLHQQPAAKAIRTITLKEAAASETTTPTTTTTVVAINTEELQQPMAITTSKTPTKKTEVEAEAILTAEAVTSKYILPKERCHVIKNDDPLRNDTRKVNSSCQTIKPSQLLENENVDACQMCEHYQVNHQSTLGCNQSRINENENGIAPNNDGGGGGGRITSIEKEKIHSIGAYHHRHHIQNQNQNRHQSQYQYQERSKDHRKDTEVQESFSCKSLQDTIEILKIKNNPFSRDTQRIIAQLETELSNFQRELQRTSSSSCSLSLPSDGRPHGESGGGGGGSVQENSKVQSKRGMSLMLDKKQEENPDEQKGNEEEPTLQDFIADKLQLEFLKHCNRPNSSSTRDRVIASISKESQTNLRSPTQMFCHLEKEKLLLMQKFRTSEMQTIQGDLNELHVFIKDQLNGIYRSITRENHQNLKYFSNDQSETCSRSRSRSQSRRSGPSDIKNKQKSRQRNFLTLQQEEEQQQPEKTQAKGLSSPPPLALLLSSSPSASPSLTAPTSSSSSVLSSSQQMHEGGITLPLPLQMPMESKKETTEELRSIWPRHYKKSSSSSSSPIPDDNENANNTKSMLKQKQVVAAAASSSSLFKLSTASAEAKAVTDAKERHQRHHHHRHHNISDVNVKVDKVDKADKAVCGKKSKYSHNLQLYGHHQEHLNANCRDAHCRLRDTPFCSDNDDDGGKKYHFSNVVDCRCQLWRLRDSSHSQPCSQPTQINDKVQRMMGARSTRPSTTTKSDINSTEKTSRLCPCPCSCPGPGQDSGPAVMTHNQRHHRHQHLPTTMTTTTTTTTGIAQDRIQLISSSLPAPTAVETAGAEAAAVMTAPPSYISTRTTDEASRKTDAVTNAAIRTIIKDAYATTVTTTTTTTDDATAAAATIVATNTATAAKAAGHSNGIREPSHQQTHNSWQRVNLKNPTGCQMKKQICGPDGYECTIKKTNNNNNDNRSNYPEIHDCQKCRANSINPFCGGLDLGLGLDSAKMHEVGADANAAAVDAYNGATAFGVATASDDFDYKCDDDVNDDGDRGNDGDDFGAGGDGPINWKGEHKSLAVAEANFTCHPEKRQRQKHNLKQKQWREQTTPRLLHCCVAQSAPAFQTDLDDFKEFLDEIILKTPTTE